MPFAPTTLSGLTGCPHCDLLLPLVDAPANHIVSCPRCGYTIDRYHPGSLDKTLALSITGLLLYFPAILLPLITLEKLGMSEKGNVIDTITNFYSSGYFFVSAMVLLAAVILPAFLLGLIFFVTLQLKTNSASARTARLFRYYVHLEEWAMVEVYLLGILVTIFKMSDTAEVSYNVGFFSFIALVFITLGITAVMDRNRFWKMLDFHSVPFSKATNKPLLNTDCLDTLTAARAGLAVCLTCNKLQLPEHSNSRSKPQPSCIRCGDRLHMRKPQSFSRTLALVVTASLLLLPANLLPIMRVDFLGTSESSTILDGILHFFENGSYLIGLIILVASVLVPLFKVVGLSILLDSTVFKRAHFLRQKAKLFRFITFIGRWSMLDIFVIALLIALVDFGILTSVHAAPAATFFCLVVAATMLAAITFDPRIMWDKHCPPHTATPNIQT